MYIIPNFVKIDRAVLEIYKSCVHAQTDIQTDSPIFYKVETYLDHLLMSKIYINPNFVKIISAVLKVYENFVHWETDRLNTQFFTRLRPIKLFSHSYIYTYTILVCLIIVGDRTNLILHSYIWYNLIRFFFFSFLELRFLYWNKCFIYFTNIFKWIYNVI